MSKQGGVLDSKQVFKGTLLQLQDKVKRDPSGYRDDVMLQLRHFESKVKLFELTPTIHSKELCELINFLSHVAPLYKQDARIFPESILQILEKHKEVLNREVRHTMVQALCLLRSRQYLEPKEVLPLWFSLFKVQDKDLRQMLLSHIVRDVKKINAKTKNPQINKQLQNYMYKVIQEDEPIAGRHALWVILDLYRRQIWTEDRIVNVISTACFSKHTKVLTMALRFFMGQFPKDQGEMEDSDDEEEPEVKGGRNFAKKTKARQTAKDKVKAKAAKIRKHKEEKVHTLFKPIEVLHDPQGFAEKLFSQLQRTKERFNVRMLHMGVISSLIHTHKLLLLNFYPFIQRYMEPHQQHVTYIMAWASQAVHELVPPDSLHSLMMTIANHFVSDHASPDAITVGINTIREICRRQPLVMTEDLLQDITQYKKYKKDKGVVMASRSMIQLFRELQPDMLARKDRGRNADTEKKITQYGFDRNKKDTIEGIELLEQYYAEKNQEKNGEVEDQWSAEESDEESSSGMSGDGSWVSVSESDGEGAQDKEVEEDADDEGWVSCDEGDEEEEEMEEEEEDEDIGSEDFQVVTDVTSGEPLTREQLAEREAASKVKVTDLMSTKVLTPRDFQILERLKAQKSEEETGRKARKRKRSEAEDDEGGVEGRVTADMLEDHTYRKRRRDAETRRAHTEAMRNSFKAKTKLQKKSGGSTNKQKQKRKLSTMVMNSRAVQSKKYETGKQRTKRMSVGKKRNIKFKYKKGGH